MRTGFDVAADRPADNSSSLGFFDILQITGGSVLVLVGVEHLRNDKSGIIAK